MSTSDSNPRSRVWLVAVGGGWGVHEMEGTEAEAEEWRCHKATWEAAPAIKLPWELVFFSDPGPGLPNWALKMMKEYVLRHPKYADSASIEELER